MNDLQILEWWAQFHCMPYARKRELLTQYFQHKTGIKCEIRLYRSVTRVSLQTYKDKRCKLLQDDILVQQALLDIGIPASTALKWYLETNKNMPFKPDMKECTNCPLNGLCEYSIPPKLWQGIKDKYNYLLVSKRMQHVLIKKERFKEALSARTGIMDDNVIRKMLRRVMQQQYYNTDFQLSPDEKRVGEVLKEQNIGVVAVLKWFFIAKNAEEKLARAARNEITPDQAELVGLEELRREIRSENLEVEE